MDSQVQGDKNISLCLKDTSGANNGVEFDSKEATNKPVLEITYTPAVPTIIDNFDDGDVSGWNSRAGNGGGTVDMSVNSSDKPDGSAYSANVTFNYGTSATWQYRYTEVDGASWSTKSHNALRLWFKGDSTNGTLASDKLKIQIRESDGDRWSYNIGNLSESTSWQQITIPFNSMYLDYTGNDGELDLANVTELNIYSNSNSKTIRMKIDKIEAIKQ